MDDNGSEKDYKKDRLNNNQANYQNETKLQLENDKENSENSALLNNRTPSPVEELSNYIDEEYERMDRADGYINA